MNATAALLVDHVIGEVPVRHWVLTLPPPLRYLCAYDRQLCNEVVSAFLDAIFDLLRRRAKQELGLRSVRQAHPGAVTAIQRASSHLALNPHLHTIATEGVYVCETEDAEPVFRALPAPSTTDQVAVAWATCMKTVAALRKRGLWMDMDPSEDRLAQDEPTLAQYYNASLRGVLALGARAGQRVMRLYGEASGVERGGVGAGEAGAASRSGSGQTPGYGFNVHAGRRVKATDRKGLESLGRYLLRPPMAQRRLELREDGRVVLHLKRAFSDGTRAYVFEPLDFLSKLAALVPPPRMHRIRFHGVWAPNAKLRSHVVPKPPQAEQPGHCEHAARQAQQPRSDRSRRKYYEWARLLSRVFAEDVMSCPRCGRGPMQYVCVVRRPDSIRKILKSIGLPADSPEPAPSRYPDQLPMFVDAVG
jgi:hypothetical protein